MTKRNTLPKEKADQIRQELMTDKSYTHIARNVGCCEATVKNYCKKWKMRYYEENDRTSQTL